mgnify:CR=1 FL=1
MITFNEAYCKWCYTDEKFVYTNLEELKDFLAGHISNDKWPPEQSRAFLKYSYQNSTIGNIIGYMSLSKESDDAYELHNLAVLPEYRHNGYGKLLLDHAKDVVKASGGNVIKIGIIEESTVLKNWYIANGFVHTETKKFDHLPFTSGYFSSE